MKTDFLIAALAVTTSASFASDLNHRATASDQYLGTLESTELNALEQEGYNESKGRAGQFVLIDAENRVLGFPDEVSTNSARLIVGFQGQLLELWVRPTGFDGGTEPLFFDSPACQGSTYLQQACCGPDSFLLSAQAIFLNEFYTTDVEAVDFTKTRDVYSSYSENEGCKDETVASTAAGVLVISEVSVPVEQCVTPDYGEDNAEIFGRGISLASSGDAIPSLQEMANTGEGVLQALFFVEGIPDATEEYDQQLPIELISTGSESDYCGAVYSGNFSPGEQTLWDCDQDHDLSVTYRMDFTIGDQPKCFEAILERLPGLTVFPRRLGSDIPALATGVYMPHYTPPLSVKRLARGVD